MLLPWGSSHICLLSRQPLCTMPPPSHHTACHHGVSYSLPRRATHRHTPCHTADMVCLASSRSGVKTQLRLWVLAVAPMTTRVTGRVSRWHGTRLSHGSVTWSLVIPFSEHKAHIPLLGWGLSQCLSWRQPDRAAYPWCKPRGRKRDRLLGDWALRLMRDQALGRGSGAGVESYFCSLMYLWGRGQEGHYCRLLLSSCCLISVDEERDAHIPSYTKLTPKIFPSSSCLRG